MTELRIHSYGDQGWKESLQSDARWLQAHRHEFRFLWVELTPPGVDHLRELGYLELDLLKKPRPIVSFSKQQLTIRLAVPQRKGQRLILKNTLLIQQPGMVLSLQEGPPLQLEPNWLSLAAQRVLDSQGLALVQELLQIALDQYFKILNDIETRLHKLEEEILANPQRQQLNQAHQIKRDLLHMRRAVWPLRESFSACLREPLNSQMEHFLLDANESCLEIIDSIETYQDLGRGLTELFVGSLTRKRSEVVKILTLMATLFAPLTFITAVYGMNFNHMPELQNPLGYPLCILLLVAVAVLTGGWFYANSRHR